MKKKVIIYGIYIFVILLCVFIYFFPAIIWNLGEIQDRIEMKKYNQSQLAYYDTCKDFNLKEKTDDINKIKIDDNSSYYVADSIIYIDSTLDFSIQINGTINEFEDAQRIYFVNDYYYVVENYNNKNQLLKFNKDEINRIELDTTGYDYLYFQKNKLYLADKSDYLSLYIINSDDSIKFDFKEKLDYNAITHIDRIDRRIYRYGNKVNNVSLNDFGYESNISGKNLALVSHTENVNSKCYDVLYEVKYIIYSNCAYYYKNNYLIRLNLNTNVYNKMKFDDNIKDFNRYSNVLTITFNNNETKSFYI